MQKYWKVLPKYDGRNVYRNGRYVTTLVANELYTPYEIQTKIPSAVIYCEQINLPKQKTYMFFGVRFETRDENRNV